jgi:hypothetical protein
MITLSYKNSIKILVDGPGLKDNYPTKEYITFDTGNDPYFFKVDDKKKTITIERAFDSMHMTIESPMKFKLWESKYSDLIFPIKREIIHKETLVRSTGYTALTDQVLEVPLNFNIMDYGMKLYAHEDSYILLYVTKAETMAYLPMMYFGLKSLFPKLCVKPVQSIGNPIETLCRKSLYCKLGRDYYLYDYFNEEDMDDIWLVYTKLDPRAFYIVSTYAGAKRLLAELKFGNHMTEFVGGVSVFEDYYFMPIHHAKISSSPKGNMTLTMPIEKIAKKQFQLEENFL